MHRLLPPLLLVCALSGTALADDPRATETRLLGYGDQGISVGTSTLFTGKVDAALYDPAQDLVWFVTGGKLEVLDLRVAGSKPVVIAKKFPTNLGFAIAGASNSEYETTYAGIYPIVHVDRKPRISVGNGAEYENAENIDPDGMKRIKHIKLVGKAWLKKQARRVANPAPTTPAPTELPHAKLPAGTCEDDAEGDSCGEATAIGATSYQLAMVESSCGDACFQECLAYDPSSGKVASPAADSAWVKPPAADLARVSCSGALHPDGDRAVYYVTLPVDSESPADPLCTIGKDGVHCQVAPGWRYFGWLPAEK